MKILGKRLILETSASIHLYHVRLSYVIKGLLTYLLTYLQSTNRCFTYASPYLWNQLPSSFRQPHSVHCPAGSQPRWYHIGSHLSVHWCAWLLGTRTTTAWPAITDKWVIQQWCHTFFTETPLPFIASPRSLSDCRGLLSSYEWHHGLSYTSAVT